MCCPCCSLIPWCVAASGALAAAQQPAQLADNLPPLPTTLPDNIVPARSLNKHYGLPTWLLAAQPLAAQIEQLHSWCTEPINLSRDGAPLSDRTWQNILQSITCFLGFCHFYLSIEAPCLQEFSEAEHYVLFIAFLMAKDLSILSLVQHISHARKVLLFQEQSAHGVAAAARLARVALWLQQLRAQLVCSIPRKRRAPDELEEEGAWMAPPELVSLFERLRVAALQALPAPGQMCTINGARLLHDACMTSCMFGYLPPIRLFCIRSMQVPTQDTCLKMECGGSRGCKGNRLAVRQGGQLWLDLPHHKNQDRWHADPIILRLPAELAHLMHCYLQQGHCVLFPQGLPYMFGDSRNGKHFDTPSAFHYYFSVLLKRLGASAVIPPSRMRHIFVDERRSLDAAPGPSNAGAATVMGNSVQEWDRSYDLDMRRRESQAAVDSMPAWREAMLERSRGMVAVQQQAADGEDSDSFVSC